jgi:phosphoserine aminotransferase
MKKHNFYAGPSILPDIALEETKKAIDDLYGSGVSLMCTSHRSKEFQSVMDEAQDLFKKLLDIPEGYHVLFVGGGASSQFYMVPFNLLNKKAAYLNTGAWATKALKEAHLFGEAVEVASSKDRNFTYIPTGYDIPTDADYFHITTNNTIYGTEIKYDMDSPVTLVADMSSDIFSRPVDISKYGVIYGGAQKNLAPAGLTFVIVREDILGKVERQIPTMVDYRTHIKKGSMFNTPPALPVFTALQTLKWLDAMGGLSVMHKKNQEKAQLLYDEIDRNKLFIPTVEKEEDRSLMNICFVMHSDYQELNDAFLAFATERNMVGIKGHRSVGGFRASTYNALPRESVEALVQAMKDFEAKH